MLKLVAQYADWHNAVITPLHEYRRKMEEIDANCEAIGRDPTSVGRSLNPSLLLRDTDDEFDRYAADRAAKRDISFDEYLDMLGGQGTIFGGPDRATEMLQQFVDAGCTYFEFILREADQEVSLHRLAELVLPKFR